MTNEVKRPFNDAAVAWDRTRKGRPMVRLYPAYTCPEPPGYHRVVELRPIAHDMERLDDRSTEVALVLLGAAWAMMRDGLRIEDVHITLSEIEEYEEILGKVDLLLGLKL